jgi:hypothetical protein
MAIKLFSEIALLGDFLTSTPPRPFYP